LLALLAVQARTIVEIGTWFGGGSTECLKGGLILDDQEFLSIDCALDKVEAARKRHDDNRIAIMHGTIVLPGEFPMFVGHPSARFEDYYEPEKQSNASAPYIMDKIPSHIDLLLLDGGEWTSAVEFRKLHDRCKIIALDDTHPDKSIKNVESRLALIEMGWKPIMDRQSDRNGWCVFKRKEL
jgi:hypothetical protein